MSKKKIITRVSEILEGFFSENGMSLYHGEYVKEGPDHILRVYIDKDDGYINTEDCEKVSRFLSDRLDEEDAIESSYILEVSSPGLDRTLVTPEHFNRFMGHDVEVSLYKELDGSKTLTGTLAGYGDEGLVLTIEGKDVAVDKKQIAKVNLAVVI